VSKQASGNTNDIGKRSLRTRLSRVIGGSSSGSISFTSISIYAFGLSGVWTASGAGILPFKVLEALEQGSVEIFGYALDKNGALGILSLLGLAVASLAQMGSGALSDRDKRLGSRLPYLLIGGFGLAVITVLFGFATSFISLLLVVTTMQLFGNFGQGPANALIIDHVPAHQRGQAAGVLNLWRLVGAGSITVIVLQFMSRYDAEESPEWLWYSITLMITVLILSTLWTVRAARPASGLFIPSIKRPVARTGSKDDAPKTPLLAKPRISRSYVAFLVALGFAIAAMSSMQIYALFFLQDVIGLENPAAGADKLVVVIVVAAALTVLPAGYMSDRFGRSNLFAVAGIAGVVSALLLLFVNSIGPTLAVGVVVGIAVGLFMTLTWAVANDLVSQSGAAKELGYTSIATLGGAAAARISGIGIDELNNISENLGYKAILIAVAVAFAFAAIILAKISTRSIGIESTGETERADAPSAPD
jgi:MFS family permease